MLCDFKFNVSSSYFFWQYNVRILVICDAYTVVARWKETFASEHNLDYTECLLRSLNCIIVRLSLAAFIGFMPNCYYCTIIQFSVHLHNQHFKEFATHQSLPDFGVQVLESLYFFCGCILMGFIILGYFRWCAVGCLEKLFLLEITALILTFKLSGRIN